MPDSSHETLLCRYHYDPLDRQSGCTVPQQPVIQRFHCDGRLTTEIQGGTRWSILQHGDQLLAQRNHREASVTATLLATDQQRSVLNTLDATGPHPLAYSPYGHHPAVDRLLSLRGFNGEQPDPLTGHYHLGNGYRQFNPVLMRFNSPDSWSPFGEGGLNAYGYCEGDPINLVDRNGHAPFWVRFFTRLNQDNKTFHIPRPQLAHNSKKLISKINQPAGAQSLTDPKHSVSTKGAEANAGIEKKQNISTNNPASGFNIEIKTKLNDLIQSRIETLDRSISKLEYKRTKEIKNARHSHNENDVARISEKIRSREEEKQHYHYWSENLDQLTNNELIEFKYELMFKRSNLP